ncbi:MAG: hypothetical protein ABIO02_03370 [Patescibacteria group bacterium]
MKKIPLIIFLVLIAISVGVVFNLNKNSRIVANQEIPTTIQNKKVVTSADNAPPGSLHNLPVPKPVSIARSAAATLFGVPEGEAIVMSAYEKEWPNGCLGLAKKDEMCTEVITPGYEVTVQGNGKVVVYRTNMDGSTIRVQE